MKTPETKAEKICLIAAAVIVAAVLLIILFETGRPSPEPARLTTGLDQEPQVIVKEVEKLIPVEKTITAEILEDGLREMGFLVTEEYYFTEVVNFSSVKTLFHTDIRLGFTESSYLASYDGIVSAGIDFTAIRAEKNEETKTITVTMPKAEIYAVDIDPESFELYSEKEGLGNPISVTDFNQSMVELEKKASDKALEKGLLERAAENGEQVVAGFINSLVDAGTYRVEYLTGK